VEKTRTIGSPEFAAFFGSLTIWCAGDYRDAEAVLGDPDQPWNVEAWRDAIEWCWDVLWKRRPVVVHLVGELERAGWVMPGEHVESAIAWASAQRWRQEA
jgi:hypothetical protein